MPAYADSILAAAEASGEHSKTQNRKGMPLPRSSDVEVVISGMSGRFPESNSVADFSENLYNGVDMITDDGRRWSPGIHGLPTRSGKLIDLKRFDASFFSVSPRQAHFMDPQLRLLLEVTHEALFDAGVHPDEIRGKNVGVYVGVSVSESENFFTKDPELASGYGLTGCCRAMFANRLSYAMDLKGPSFAIDTACSSSLVALSNAWSAIKSGEIESAIVAGSNLTLKPESSMQFNALSMLSEDGRCKSFDSSANGYVRSEAVVAVYLQRSSDAKRIYSQVVQVKMNTDGFKSKGITFPSGEMQKSLLQEVYKEAGISPTLVSYVEAHGTGTKVGDPQEVNSIADAMCIERKEPLLMGSVKSNMGHSESASGLCSVVKVLLAMQNREIPANLHYNSPNPEIPSLVDGKIKVVSANTPWRGGYAAINSFGFGGANVHVLLKCSEAPSQTLSPGATVTDDFCLKDIPRLLLGSGRTEEAVELLMKEVKRTNNPYVAALLNRVSNTTSLLHPYRGFSLMTKAETNNNITKVIQCPASKAPLWLIFSGMGSQWTGCGKQLMRIPAFANAIERCRPALLPYDVDVAKVITETDPDPMVSSTNSFTAIAAMQIGLVEVLRSIGLRDFDGFLGHSVGELGCAFADGTLTAEQTVLTAYWRGKAVEEADLPSGAMAAVGLSGEEAKKYCKNGPVVVACYNSANSVTISGPNKEVEKIQSELNAKEIFCRSVSSGGVAFHHTSLSKAAPRLRSELQKIIPMAHLRSPRWVSSSVPEEHQNKDFTKRASAEYFVNNLVSPVLFAQGLEKIPEDAVIIEVAPHALLQAVLRRATPKATLIPLIRKEAQNPLAHFLQSLGALYTAGFEVNTSSLYPINVRYPVPLNTPGLGSYMMWDHDGEWDVASFSGCPPTSEYKIEVDLNSTEFGYIEGHTIDGRILYPATGYLMLVWRALSKLMGTKWEETPVTFNEVYLHQATVFSASNPVVTFTVRILLSNGEFEVLAGEAITVTGKIQAGVKQSTERDMLQNILVKKHKFEQKGSLKLKQDEVYKELKLRGYEYKGLFQGIENADINGKLSQVKWQSNWVAFLDTMLQASLLGSTSRGLSLPTRIRKVIIDPSIFVNALQDNEEGGKFIEVSSNPNLTITACPGIEIYGLKATTAPRRIIQDEPQLESYKFIPKLLTEKHEISASLSDSDALRLLLDQVIENQLALKIKVTQVMTPIKSYSKENDILYYPQRISKLFNHYPQLNLEYSLLPKQKLTESEKEQLGELGVKITDTLDASMLAKQHLLILPGFDHDEILKKLTGENFILIENFNTQELFETAGMITVASVEKYNLCLMKNEQDIQKYSTVNISNKESSFSWFEELKEKVLSSDNSPVWLLSSGEQFSGILGMFNCLRREPGGEKLRCFINEDGDKISDSEFKCLVSSDLAVNIISNGIHGTMRHLELPPLKTEPSNYAYLNVITRGDLASLTWLRGAPPEVETRGKSLLSTVHYAPLNFRDIMLASGKLPPDALPGGLANKDCVLGLEFAGITDDGSRVMGLVPAGGLATSIRSDPLLTWRIPSSWSLKEAATVPVVYATAYYALIVRGGLKRGESVLIHAGSGGVGQAAISIALSRNCRVFTTVSSEKKRTFLKEKFPQLNNDSFANSRDSSFEYNIMERTDGEGVDIVLNSLAGELLQASVRCLKEHGRFLEIGKADLANNTALGMAIFLKNVTFHGILLDALFSGRVEERRRLQELLYEGMIIGEVVPLPATCYSYDCAEEAFRYMASGKHIGKVVLEMIPKLSEKSPTAKSHLVPSVYRFWPRANHVYIITGGLGGVGLELCNWLINRGAGKIVLTSRKGISTGYQALCMKRWQSTGAEVRILTQDASTLKGAENLIREAANSGPVGGIFHLATILEDSILENQSSEKFQRVCHIKGNGAIALDKASRNLCPDLHIWLTFSSVACGRGNAGQSNYAFANSTSEKVVRERVEDGLHGIAIQFGGIGDVGILASTLGNIEVGGTKPQSVRSVIACLDDLIGSGEAVVSSLCLATGKSTKDSKGSKSLISAVANVLGIRDISKAPTTVTFGDLGMDSLMAVEIKQTLEREADIVLTPEAIRDLTLSNLQEIESSLSESQDTQSSSKSEMIFSWLDYPLIPTTVLYPLCDVDSKAPPLFIFSPMQGTCEVLREVAEKLERKVYGLQYTPDCPNDGIREMAEYMVKVIERVQPEGDVDIAGYSFGACIAVEVTRQFEEKSRNVSSLSLIDGSHCYVTSVIKSLFSSNMNLPTNIGEAFAKEGIEALLFYTQQLCVVDGIKLRKELSKYSTWDDMAAHTAETILHTLGEEKVAYLKLTSNTIISSSLMFFRRLRAAVNHDVSGLSINARTLLVRAAQNTHAEELHSDYGLSEVVKNDVKVEVLPGNHESVISGESAAKVASFISDFLR